MFWSTIIITIRGHSISLSNNSFRCKYEIRNLKPSIIIADTRNYNIPYVTTTHHNHVPLNLVHLN